MESAFGVEHGYVSKRDYSPKEKKRMNAAATAGGIFGGVYGGIPVAIGAQVGGQAAGIKATKMHRASNNPTVDPKQAAHPSYGKYTKAQNLADHAGTPGEKAAAQSAADRMKAKHGFTPPKTKKLGSAYKVLRGVQRATGTNKRAMAIGITAATVAGAGIGHAGSKHNINRGH